LIKDSSTRCFYIPLTIRPAASGTQAGSTAPLAFSLGNRLVSSRVLCGQAQTLGAFSMAMSLLVSRLSVIAAYAALAFVGAIVVGLL
jgi:hypothetical protein